MMHVEDASSPRVGIYWLVDTPTGQTRLLSSSCTLDNAESYGDFLVFGPGHYEIWDQWREKSNPDITTRTVARQWEYEDWPRGRVLYDRVKDCFILYADRKLMQAETLKKIQEHFRLPRARVLIEGDLHYQSVKTPGKLPQ
jgi:hypothetical protein